MILLNKAKNYIANGALDFWQRGSSFTSIATGKYSADRFIYGKVGLVVMNITKDSDVPTFSQSGFNFSSSINLSNTAAMPVGAGDYSYISQRIEGQLFSPISGRKLTLSFWVKASVTGIYPVAFRNNSISLATRSYVSTYTVNVANTWEKKTITLTHSSSGSWNYTTGIGMEVMFPLASGTTFRAPSTDTWVDGDYISHSSCVNAVQTNGQTFKITGIQLEEGSDSSNFERMGGFLDNELRLCQRYFEKSYDLDVAVGTSSVLAGMVVCPRAETVTTNRQVFHKNFIATKRTATPIIVNYSYLGASGYVCQYNATATNILYDINAMIAKNSFGFNSALNIAVTTTSGIEAVAFHWTAEAEL